MVYSARSKHLLKQSTNKLWSSLPQDINQEKTCKKEENIIDVI